MLSKSIKVDKVFRDFIKKTGIDPVKLEHFSYRKKLYFEKKFSRINLLFKVVKIYYYKPRIKIFHTYGYKQEEIDTETSEKNREEIWKDFDEYARAHKERNIYIDEITGEKYKKTRYANTRYYKKMVQQRGPNGKLAGSKTKWVVRIEDFDQREAEVKVLKEQNKIFINIKK